MIANHWPQIAENDVGEELWQKMKIWIGKFIRAKVKSLGHLDVLEVR